MIRDTVLNVHMTHFNIFVSSEDGCVSHQEYLDAHSNQPQEVADKMYYHFENDGDNCLNVQDMQEEFHLIDHDSKLILYL